MSTLKKYNFENGTAGSALSSSDTPTSGETAFNLVTVQSGGTCTYDTTQAAHGTQSVKLVPGSGLTDDFRWTGYSASSFSISFYIYMTALPTAELFLARGTAGGANVFTVELSNSGKLRLLDTRGTSTIVWGATNTLPLNQWVRIEAYVTINASTAVENVAYYLGDSTTASESGSTSAGNTGSTNIDTIIFGKFDTSTYVTPYWFDAIQAEDGTTGFLGPWPAAPATTVYPISVFLNSGGYTNVGGAASIPAALADSSDSTYAQSPANPTGPAQLVVQIGTLTPGLPTVTVRSVASAASPPVTRTLALVQLPGLTVISSRTIDPVPTSDTTFSWTLTSTEESNITDFTQLGVSISDTV